MTLVHQDRREIKAAREETAYKDYLDPMDYQGNQEIKDLELV